MENSEPLILLGAAVILITAAFIAVPYLRRRSDALTAWNLLLLGGAIFIGIGSLEVVYGIFHWPELQWFQPRTRDVEKYILGVIVFYTTLLVSYYWLKLPRRISSRFLNKWPELQAAYLFPMLAGLLFLSLAAMLVKGVVFVTPLLVNVSHKAILFAAVLSFCYWYRNYRNLALLALFGGIFIYAGLYSMVVFSGRRLMLSVVTAPLFCLYWLRWRYLSPKANLIRLGLAAAIAVGATGFYSTIRHYRADTSGESRSFGTVVKAIRSASVQGSISAISRDWMHYFAQYAGHYSLLTIQLVDTKEVEVEPLNTLAFVATYPIPRAVYPSKPALMSTRIVRQVLRLPYQTNWGLGIVAQGYQEGGLVVIVLYGFLCVLVVRLIDDAVARQPDNAFLLAMLTASAPHIVMTIRGDLATVAVEVLEAIAFAWLLGLVGRIISSRR